MTQVNQIRRTKAGNSTTSNKVVIAGAGLGGLGAAIFLQRAGLQVTCIEPEPFPHARVGESLDWSSPRLLAALGLSRDQLVEEQIATYKHGIRAEPLGTEPFESAPPDRLGRSPFGFELVTLHVDRVAFDQRLFEVAQSLGVTFIWDRVTSIETEGERIVACRTAGGLRIAGKWFIDNSGQARVFAKALGIPKVEYGRRKVCLWTYFDQTLRCKTTTFYADNSDEYLTWTWEIPITPKKVSVGCIMAADELKERRRNGRSVGDILRAELAKYERFTQMISEQPDTEISTCSYRSYVNERVCGPNWLMVGEAASLPDPLTANGVTAAFRHAQDASEAILKSARQGALTKRQQHVFTSNVCGMGHAFNHSIEKAVYEWPVRRSLNPQAAQRVYTTFAFLTNAIYTKFRPQTRLPLALFGFWLHIGWLWMEGWALAARFAFYRRQSRSGLRQGRSKGKLASRVGS